MPTSKLITGGGGAHDLLLFVLFFLLLLIQQSTTTTTTHSDSEPLIKKLQPQPLIRIRKIAYEHVLLKDGDGDDRETYAVIFDAGSSGSRVHVFHFDQNLDLVSIGNDLELYVAIKPGLSSYADDPEAAALSLKPLLEKAEEVIPGERRSETPVRLGATAGLRLLNGGAAERILDAVRELLKKESPFKYRSDWVSILDGSDEGAYEWIAINYLLGNLGKTYPNTVGVVDLGGGSVQMAYAVSKEMAAEAAQISNGSSYVQQRLLLGTHYDLYSHSYLNYGILAARAEILKLSGKSGNPCILDGFDGSYTYNNIVYKASSTPYGSNRKSCSAIIKKALKVDAPCNYTTCTFNGVWSGGGGKGQNNLYVASFFYDFAVAAGIVDPSLPSAVVRPMSFWKAAGLACKTKYENITSRFPQLEDTNAPYLCMDLVYEFTLLVHGFGINPSKKITVVKDIKYKNSLLGAAWPLGCAIDVVSSTSTQ